MTLVMGAGIADAAVRDANSATRNTTKNAITRQTHTTTDKVQRNTTARTTAKNTVARTVTTNRTTARTATTARSARATTTARTATTARNARTATTARTAKPQNIARNAMRPARATITLNAMHSNTFGTGYNTCRDAYFTCMDQFCSTANDAYRRCICSSKLSEIQSRERALGQASSQLQDFHDLNLAVINKTAAEVNAMLSATEGEFTQSITTDKSASASQLSGISEVLSKTKNKSLSTQGALDIAGDINAIWATTDLTGGTNIANLTGEALYNAVHAQCSEMVIDKCPDTSTQTMVVSAYGMYIENDCSLLINELDKKLTNANGTIRATEREMNLARLENYNAHNSTAINDCIAQVRADITANTACGPDYVHCLDVTGRYLNYETGEPIYTPDFYQLESQISLSGDILTNQTNRILVATLNNMREYAARGLDTCRDLADDVWNEFMRQAITEIYQGQQERIRTVKNECLDVVTTCYDEQSKSLKDFSNVKDQLLLGSRLELSEQMCREKLDACSNLYGGGSHGMAELLTAMYDITSQKIANQCQTTLQDYARELCAVPSNDTLHSYPYACRVYAPGEQIYATIHACNISTNNQTNASVGAGIPDTDTSGTPEDGASGYVCPTSKIYTNCNAGFYMSKNGTPNSVPSPGNSCTPCPTDCTCAGGTAGPTNCTNTNENTDDGPDCGDDYIGSLYHKMARYAMQACVRPSESAKSDFQMPATVLQDINAVMDKIRTDMANALSRECERLNGLWVDTVWTDKTDCPTESTDCDPDTGDDIHDITGHTLHKKFYSETSANTKWGFCATITDDATNKTTNDNNTDTTTPTP